MTKFVRRWAGWKNRQPAGCRTSHGGKPGTATTDAWESEEAFNTFAAERLGPGMAKAGVESQPQVTLYPAHEVYAPQAVTLTVLNQAA